MKKGDLSYTINGCAMLVHQKMGRGSLEYIYCRALAIELNQANIHFERERWIPIYYGHYKIGARRVDFFCEHQMTVELKAKNALTNDDFVQALNTLEKANVKEGLLLNFGGISLEIRHLFNSKYQPNKQVVDITPELVGEPSSDRWDLNNYVPSTYPKYVF
ncbi:MAG: hypothetical protein RLZZ628_4467 [Bacteroidota bacterium]|jgi:GxxExxY protein